MSRTKYLFTTILLVITGRLLAQRTLNCKNSDFFILQEDEQEVICDFGTHEVFLFGKIYNDKVKIHSTDNILVTVEGVTKEIKSETEFDCDFNNQNRIITVNRNNSKNVTFYVSFYENYLGLGLLANWSSPVSVTLFTDTQSKELKVEAEITNSTCAGDDGAIDISLNDLDTYMRFTGRENVSIDKLSLFGADAFTIESRIRVVEGVEQFKNREYISLVGQDNVFQWGFSRGKLSSRVWIDNKSVDIKATDYYPNDGNWHNVVLRWDEKNLELLIDGNIKESISAIGKSLGRNNSSKKMKVADDVWGSNNEAFKGDIGRMSFWEEALTDEEIQAYKLLESSSLDGDEDGLIVTYNMNKQEGNEMYAVANGDYSYEGIITGGSDLWQARITSYEWSSNAGVVPTGQNKNQDIKGLIKGDYNLKIIYETQNGTKSLEENYIVNLDNTLKVNLTSEKYECCEGALLQVGTDITGLVGTKANPDRYIWEINSDDTSTVTVEGNSEGCKLPQELKTGERKLTLTVKSGVCETKSNDVNLIIHKNITTNRIRRRKDNQ